MNKIIDDLIDLGLSTKDSFELFNSKTRDLDDLHALKCKKSDVIVLEDVRFRENYYRSVEHYHESNKEILRTSDDVISIYPLEDDLRRFNAYKELINNKSLLDFGCGKGGFLKLSSQVSSLCMGVELENKNRKVINESGTKCVQNLEEIEDIKFDVITLNHVFEHLLRPLDYVKEIVKYIKDDGLLVIEVPHARDILLSFFNLQEFKDFSLWSEHLILHTKESLEKFVTFQNKFKLINIEGYQRYPISNHFLWLKEGKPGGHKEFEEIYDEKFHKSYSSFLSKLDMTDTIIGFFKKA